MEIEDLGRRVSLHITDNRKRIAGVIGLLTMAAVTLTVAVQAIIWDSNTPWGPQPEDTQRRAVQEVIGGATAIAGLCLVFGIFHLLRWLRARGETFEVHEHGLAHSANGSVSVIGWHDVVSVKTRGFETLGLWHAIGSDFFCKVRLADGRRLKFSSFTSSASELAAAIDSRATKQPSQT
jgi:hypothetical protein